MTDVLFTDTHPHVRDSGAGEMSGIMKTFTPSDYI